MEGNLTRGPILKTLTKLAIPIMASSFLGTLYNITDMAWIGLLGAKAVAGVGVGGMFTWLSQGLASMARMGGQVQIAQCIGRGEKEKAHGYAQTAMQLALLMGLAYGIIVALFANQLVGFFKLDDAETLSAALDYTNSLDIEYAYKLDDNQWYYIGKKNSVSFVSLPAGKYQFQIKATNGDGIWMNTVKTVTLQVLPTFWETGWAKAFYLVVVLVISDMFFSIFTI